MPPAGLAPWINVTTSTFAEDWKRLLTDDLVEPDVKFISGNNTIFGHQVILAASSVIFKEIFLTPKKMNKVPKKYSSIFEEIKWINGDLRSNNYTNNLNIEVSNDSHSRESAEITLNSSIDFEVFNKILRFFYTGLPGFAEVEVEDFVRDVKETSKLFHLPWLTQVCENRLKDEQFLNPSIGTWLNDETGEDCVRSQSSVDGKVRCYGGHVRRKFHRE
ncbi:Rho-related protein racA [Exaiptasia diaphana]|nr:Rho-related protein racA [Exaiptasia diaphana]